MNHGEMHVTGCWRLPSAAALSVLLSACSALPMMPAHTSGFAGAGGTDGRRSLSHDPDAEGADGLPSRVAMGPFFDFGRMAVRDLPVASADPNAAYRLPGASLALDHDATGDSLLKVKAPALPSLRRAAQRTDERSTTDSPQ